MSFVTSKRKVPTVLLVGVTFTHLQSWFTSAYVDTHLPNGL